MSAPTKTILVTGVTGQVGGELAKRLVAAGADVRGLTRDASHARAALHGARAVQGDFDVPSTLAAAFAGAQSAFFVAPASPRLAELGGHFFEAAKNAGVRHVVIVSSATIQFEPRPAIGHWHWELEQRLEASGLGWTMLRPGNFASNVLRWVPMIRGQGTVFQPYGDAKSSPIDPHDIAAVAFTALTTPNHEGKRYTLTGPELLSAREQVEKIGKVLGKVIRFIDVPEDGARRGMIGAGMPELMADAVLEVVRASATSGGFKTTTVRDVTGREARSFDDWLRDTAAALA